LIVEIEDNIDYTIQLRDCGWFETGNTIPQNEYYPIPLSAKIVEDMKSITVLVTLSYLSVQFLLLLLMEYSSLIF
jgi:hypothetical protein